MFLCVFCPAITNNIHFISKSRWKPDHHTNMCCWVSHSKTIAINMQLVSPFCYKSLHSSGIIKLNYKKAWHAIRVASYPKGVWWDRIQGFVPCHLGKLCLFGPHLVHCATACKNVILGSTYCIGVMFHLVLAIYCTLCFFHCFSVLNSRIPLGRSWHTLNAVSETTLFLFGGLSVDCRPMSELVL